MTKSIKKRKYNIKTQEEFANFLQDRISKLTGFDSNKLKNLYEGKI